MKLDTNGLPQWGRELDAAVWEMLGHEVEWKCCACGEYGGWYELGDEWPERKIRMYGPEEQWEDYVRAILARQPCYCEDGIWFVVPFVSTSHAYHSVMDALRPSYIWLFREDSTGIGVALRPIDCDGHSGSFWECNLDWNDPPDSERLYAHAVCAAVWMATGGQDA